MPNATRVPPIRKMSAILSFRSIMDTPLVGVMSNSQSADGLFDRRTIVNRWAISRIVRRGGDFPDRRSFQLIMARSGTKKTHSKKRWVARVKTDSTHPPEGLFTKHAAMIARTLASKRVSPKGA